MMESMEVYQHDGPCTYRFVLRGSLEGRWVRELECAWISARSILKGKDVVVDVSGLTGANEDGIQLLSRMAESGVLLTAAAPPGSPSLVSRAWDSGSAGPAKTCLSRWPLAPLFVRAIRVRWRAAAVKLRAHGTAEFGGCHGKCRYSAAGQIISGAMASPLLGDAALVQDGLRRKRIHRHLAPAFSRRPPSLALPHSQSWQELGSNQPAHPTIPGYVRSPGRRLGCHPGRQKPARGNRHSRCGRCRRRSGPGGPGDRTTRQRGNSPRSPRTTAASSYQLSARRCTRKG
jgi:hypothetical protein